MTIESTAGGRGRYAGRAYVDHPTFNDKPIDSTVEIVEKAGPTFRDGDVVLLSIPMPLYLVRTSDTWHRIGDTWSCDDPWVKVQLDRDYGRIFGHVSELPALREEIRCLKIDLEAASSVADQAVDAKIVLEQENEQLQAKYELACRANEGIDADRAKALRENRKLREEVELQKTAGLVREGQIQELEAEVLAQKVWADDRDGWRAKFEEACQANERVDAERAEAERKFRQMKEQAYDENEKLGRLRDAIDSAIDDPWLNDGTRAELRRIRGTS